MCGDQKPHASYLLQLHISSCRVSSGMLYKIAGFCPNLRHLKIKRCCGLSNRVISKIAQIHHLESLNLSYNIKNVKRFAKYRDIKDTTLCKIVHSSPNL